MKKNKINFFSIAELTQDEIKELKKRLKEYQIKVFSASQLREEDFDIIRRKFNLSMDEKIENIIYKDLIAGAVVIYRNKVYDFSLKGRLLNLKTILYEFINRI